MASLRRMTSNVAAQVFAVAASIIDRIILVGVILRHWGADVFSDYSVIQSWASLLLVAELGIQLYFQNCQQAAFVTGDTKRFRRYAAIHLGLLLAMVGALATAFTLACWVGGLDRVMDITHIDAPSARAMLWMFGIGNLFTLLRSATTSIYSATGDFAYSVVIAALALVVNTLASLACVAMGAGPTTLAALFLLIGGAGAAAFCAWDVSRRYPQWVAAPALPTIAELREAFVHIKWFALQVVTPTLWLQAPILVFSAFGVSGRDITAFLLIRTMVNQIRQSFQFASIGAGLEIATLAHRGDFNHAWRLSAQVGLLTTTLAAASAAGVMCFGQNVTLYWAGDPSLFVAPIALAMLVPLLAVAPLQQPLAMLQYANRSLAPGLQRLAQIVLGPALCWLGESLGGTLGLAIGLAIAEIAANWILIPLFASMSIFAGFARYCLSAIGVGLGSAAVCWLVGTALNFALPSPALGWLAVKGLVWTLFAVAPLIAVTLPDPIRRAIATRSAGVARTLFGRRA